MQRLQNQFFAKHLSLNRIFLLFLTVIFFAFLFFVPLRFEENDDIVMNMLSSGAYSGDPSANLVFINYILGLLLSGLYALFPGVHWYSGIMLFALSVCCALGLTTAADRVWNTKTFNLFAFTALGSLLLMVMAHMQFTTTAALCVVVGAWSFLTMPGRLIQVMSGGIVLFGILLRFEAAVLVLVVSAPFFMLGFLGGVVPYARALRLIAILLVGLSLEVFSEYTNQSLHPSYVAFNDVRGQLNDNPNAERLPSEQLPNGVSINDYGLLLEFFADPREIELDEISAIHDSVSELEQRFTLRDWLGSAAATLKRKETFLVLCALIAAAVFVRGRNQRLLLITSCLLFLLPLVYVNLFATLKYRVLLGAVASALAGLFYVNLHGTPKWLVLLAQVPLIGVTVFFLLHTKGRIAETVRNEPAFRAQVEVIEDWDGLVYIYKNHLSVEDARLFSNDLAPFARKIIFAGWMVRHPDNKNYQSHRDLLQEDVALFLKPRDAEAATTRILEALSENYGISAVAQTVTEIDNGLLVTFRYASEL